MSQQGVVKVGVLGASGVVGQRFCSLLAVHPWMKIHKVGGSVRRQGHRLDEGPWILDEVLDKEIGALVLGGCDPKDFEGCEIVFSALPSEVAESVEPEFCKAGYVVISNSSNGRMQHGIPLLIGGVNDDHLDMLKQQRWGGKGCLIKNPNCVVAGLATVLRPLHHELELQEVIVATCQAVSGAGHPGVPSMDVLGNVIPYIPGEIDKIETEPLKILGTPDGAATFKVVAMCHRVPVLEGHTVSVYVTFGRETDSKQIQEILNKGVNIKYIDVVDRPQPRKDIGRGDCVTVGQLRMCTSKSCTFTLVASNTIYGAAGCAIANAEAYVRFFGTLMSQ